MRSGNRTLHWDSRLIPNQRAHFDPKAGDARNAILATSKRPVGPDGIRAVDCNVQVVTAWVKHPITGKRYLRMVAYLLHWANAGQNGYTRVVDAKTGRVRPMTKAELRRPLAWWGPDGVNRWRRPNGEKPLRYSQAVRLAAEHGVVIVGELKSLLFRTRTMMRAMVAAARKADHPAWFMALYGSMKGCRQKGEATVAEHGQFLVIFGKWRAKFARVTPIGTRWWTKPGIYVERSTWKDAR